MQALQGVRRAQTILACTYLVAGRKDLTQQIQEDFGEGESHKRLWGIMKELQNVTHREFWEVSERGTNFTWMNPEQKAQLPIFFRWFKNFSEDVPLNANERRKFERQQALSNFE